MFTKINYFIAFKESEIKRCHTAVLSEMVYIKLVPQKHIHLNPAKDAHKYAKIHIKSI